jgi:hypothetical protein
MILLLLPLLILAQTPTADEIMSHVAENQERAKAARTRYVYDSNVLVRLKRANGKLAREESRDYVVAPTEKGAQRKLIRVEGKVLEGKKEIAYEDAKFRTKSIDIDGEITDSFAGDVMWSKDEFGPMVDWFPLAGSEKSKFSFQLEGEEKYREYETEKPVQLNQPHRFGAHAIEGNRACLAIAQRYRRRGIRIAQATASVYIVRTFGTVEMLVKLCKISVCVNQPWRGAHRPDKLLSDVTLPIAFSCRPSRPSHVSAAHVCGHLHRRHQQRNLRLPAGCENRQTDVRSDWLPRRPIPPGSPFIRAANSSTPSMK